MFKACIFHFIVSGLLLCVPGLALTSDQDGGAVHQGTGQAEPAAFGAGARYNIFASHNVWAGLDLARGPEDWTWYIQVGHPW